MNFTKEFLLKPGDRFRFARWNPAQTYGIEKEDSARRLEKNIDRLFLLQHLLYAENQRSLLVILQGMDTSGKDGVIRHVIRGFNPQGCTVTPFKTPSVEELDHDFLWRIHKAVPARGDIGVFNRSHYEDVLVVRVRKMITKSVWRHRYKQINHFERMLVENGMTILKFFLYISKEEQRLRLLDRIHNPAKNWKFNERDIVERKNWSRYKQAYEEALTECSTEWAPWFVIPADKKWFRNLAVSEIIRDALERMKLRLPKRSMDAKRLGRLLT